MKYFLLLFILGWHGVAAQYVGLGNDEVEQLREWLRATGVDYYSWVSPAGSSIRRSVAWLLPFVTGEKTHAEFVNSTVDGGSVSGVGKRSRSVGGSEMIAAAEKDAVGNRLCWDEDLAVKDLLPEIGLDE
jgi:hypothetical protein